MEIINAVVVIEGICIGFLAAYVVYQNKRLKASATEKQTAALKAVTELSAKVPKIKIENSVAVFTTPDEQNELVEFKVVKQP